MSARVKLADRALDRPRAGSLVAVAAAALCAGFAMAQGMRQLLSHPEAVPAARPSAQPEPSPGLPPQVPEAHAPEIAVEPHTTTAGIEAAEQTPIAATAVLAVAPPSPPVEAPPEPPAAAVPPPAPAPPATPEAKEAAAPQLANIDASAVERGPRFQMGIVAYDRCDGLSQRPGRYPCPRDLKLEQQVWQALRGLEDCKLAQAERGQGELRYEWIDGRAMQLRVRGPKRGAVAHTVVTKCAGRALAAARSEFVADHMIVRFRFELD